MITGDSEYEEEGLTAMANFDPQKHHRRSIRLKGYDYTQPGAYFVTLVTWQRECLFGEVRSGEMRLNTFGFLVEKDLNRILLPRPYGMILILPHPNK